MMSGASIKTLNMVHQRQPRRGGKEDLTKRQRMKIQRLVTLLSVQF